MLTFEVNDMTCGHCARTITEAVNAVDSGARVQIDLNARRVQVASTKADARELAEAIKEAGYTPVPVQPEAATAKPVKTGGCCSSSSPPPLDSARPLTFR
jgi:copper chaperone